jgi:hypothetical protein
MRVHCSPSRIARQSIAMQVTRMAIVGATCAIAVVVAFSDLGVVRAQGLRWSEPVRVSTPIPNQVDWWPAVAADDAGNVHIFWNSTQYGDGPGQQKPNAVGQLAYVRWNGQSLTEQADLAVIWYGYAIRSSVVVDPNGRLHLIYKGWQDPGEVQEAGRGGQDLFYTAVDGRLADAYTAWSFPTRINRGQLAYYPVIALDSRGVLHALWAETDATGKFGLYYSHSSDGGSTWSDRSFLEIMEPVWWYRLQMQVDGADRIHIVFEIGGQDETATGLTFGVTRGAVYLQSRDGGYSWSKHEFGGQPVGRSVPAEMRAPGPQQPTIGVDGNGTRLLVFREAGTDRILFRQSADGVLWSEPQPLPGLARGVSRPYDTYDTVTDSAGHVHLVVVGIPTGSEAMAVLHSEWDGQQWLRPETIASAPPYPEYPRITVGQGNRLHVVWFDGDKPLISRVPSMGIWYSTAVTSATTRPQAVTRLAPSIPIPNPTSVPPTPTVAGPPPSEVLPDASRASYYETARPSSDFGSVRNQPIFPVLIALVPALALMLIAVSIQLGLAKRLLLKLWRK